jgi:hypothetical protein
MMIEGGEGFSISLALRADALARDSNVAMTSD